MSIGLELFDLKKIVRGLDGIINQTTEGKIKLGEFEPISYSRIYSIKGNKWENRLTIGEYSILQEGFYGGAIGALVDLRMETEIGSICIEKRETSLNERFEKVILSVNKPLTTNNGSILPKFKIEIYQEINGEGKRKSTRNDFVKRVIIYREGDLKGVFPTELFLIQNPNIF